MNQRDQAALVDIHLAAQRALLFIEDIDLGAFQSDLETQSAILYQLTILGEAVNACLSSSAVRSSPQPACIRVENFSSMVDGSNTPEDFNPQDPQVFAIATAIRYYM